MCVCVCAKGLSTIKGTQSRLRVLDWILLSALRQTFVRFSFPFFGQLEGRTSEINVAAVDASLCSQTACVILAIKRNPYSQFSS